MIKLRPLPALPARDAKTDVKLKYVQLTAKDKNKNVRSYLISAASIAMKYAEEAAADVVDTAYPDIYWSHFFWIYESDSNILETLDRISTYDMDWILETASPYNTEEDLTLDDIDRNWNSIKTSVVCRVLAPFVERSKHRMTKVQIEERERLKNEEKFQMMLADLRSQGWELIERSVLDELIDEKQQLDEELTDDDCVSEECEEESAEPRPVIKKIVPNSGLDDIPTVFFEGIADV